MCAPIAHANSPILVDAKGHAIGYFVNQSGICKDATTTPVYSFDGYLACFLDTGKADYSLQPPGTFGLWQGGFFTTPDCSGFDTQWATQVAGPLGGGYIVSTSQGLMGATGAIEQIESISGIWDPQSGSCVPISPAANYFAVLLLPATTIEHYLNPSPYLPPLTVQSLPATALEDVIFFDSMDVEY